MVLQSKQELKVRFVAKLGFTYAGMQGSSIFPNASRLAAASFR
jgi:hypothetical protein